MNRTHVERLHSDPTWAESYNRNLAKAESLRGEGSLDAQAYASVAADLEVSESEKAETARAEREANILADHRARQSVEAARPAATPAPAPDPAARAKAGWKAAAAKVNANVTDHPKPAHGEPAKTVGALLDQHEQRKAQPSPDASRGWAKAAAAANAERGL